MGTIVKFKSPKFHFIFTFKFSEKFELRRLCRRKRETLARKIAGKSVKNAILSCFTSIIEVCKINKRLVSLDHFGSIGKNFEMDQHAVYSVLSWSHGDSRPLTSGSRIVRIRFVFKDNCDNGASHYRCIVIKSTGSVNFTETENSATRLVWLWAYLGVRMECSPIRASTWKFRHFGRSLRVFAQPHIYLMKAWDSNAHCYEISFQWRSSSWRNFVKSI